MQSWWPEWSRVSMAFERQQSAADSLTRPAPAFQRWAFQTKLDNTDCSPASDWPLSRLGTGPATEGLSHGLTPPTSNTPPPPKPLTGPLKGLLGAKVSGQVDLWPPAMFGHVHTQCEAQGRWLQYGGWWKRPRGLRTVAGSCLCEFVCMLLAWRPGQRLSDHRTSPENPSLPPDVQPLYQVSLLGARREELHQGWSRITGPACLSGWAYFCWLGLVLSSSQCCHHRADPFDVLIHWPPHRNTSHVVLSKNWRHCVGFGAEVICNTEDETTAAIRLEFRFQNDMPTVTKNCWLVKKYLLFLYIISYKGMCMWKDV